MSYEDDEDEKDDLTFRQKLFTESFLETGNATKAAIEAGYSEKTARQIGSENLSKPDIKERIEARIKDSQVTADEVIGVLASHLRADIGDLYPDLPVVKRAKEMGVSHLIRKVVVKRYYDKLLKSEVEEVSLEIHNSQSAAKQLANMLGLERQKAPNPLGAARAAYDRLVEDEKWRGLGRESIARAVSRTYGIDVEQIMTDDETVM
jgi:phage terminase small subunit